MESLANPNQEWFGDYCANLYLTYLQINGKLALDWVSPSAILEIYNHILEVSTNEKRNKILELLGIVYEECYSKLKFICWPQFEASDDFYRMTSLFSQETSLASYRSRKMSMIFLVKCFPNIKLPDNPDVYEIITEENQEEIEPPPQTYEEIIEEKIISYLRYSAFKLNDDLDPYAIQRVHRLLI